MQVPADNCPGAGLEQIHQRLQPSRLITQAQQSQGRNVLAAGTGLLTAQAITALAVAEDKTKPARPLNLAHKDLNVIPSDQTGVIPLKGEKTDLTAVDHFQPLFNNSFREPGLEDSGIIHGQNRGIFQWRTGRGE